MIIGALLGLTALACFEDREQPTSPQGPTPPHWMHSASSLEQSSQAGRYRVSLRRESPEGPYSVVHDWLVRIEDVNGQLVRPIRLAFSGGMPQHGHGFQTAPYVTEALDGGWFRIGGVRFHMAGDWTLKVEFVGPDGPDVAVFEVSIPP